MANFPTTFETPVLLPYGISAEADAALNYLNDQNLQVYAGLSPELAAQYAQLGRETEIKEMCPKDASDKRFGATEASILESTAAWLSKGDETLGEYGRGALSVVDGGLFFAKPAVAAYGWIGPEVPTAPKGSEEYPTPQLLIDEFDLVIGGLHLRTTYANRVSERYAKRGIGKALSVLLVHGGNALWGGEDFWLDTWKSNHAGPKVYLPTGWQKRPIEIPAMRPSVKAGHDVVDVRTWYTYPNAKLPNAN